MPTNFTYQTSRRVAIAVCVLFIITGIGIVSFAFYIHKYEHASVWLSLFAGAIGSLLIMVGSLPQNRQPQIYFKADKEGLHFPRNTVVDDSTPWLHVPWENVGVVQEERMYSRVQGITLELKLSAESVQAYFGATDKANKLLGIVNRRSGYFVVGYSRKVLTDFSKALAVINRLRPA